MKNPKLTPIFPPEIKPTQEGVYMVSTSLIGFEKAFKQVYAKFEEGLWGVYYSSIQEAHDLPMDCFYADQSKFWRGIAK